MSVFEPAPEEQEPWGDVIWDSVTGLEENDTLILERGEERMRQLDTVIYYAFYIVYIIWDSVTGLEENDTLILER